MAYERQDYAGLITATTLNGAINNSVTALTLTSATGWPTVDDGGNYAIIDPGLPTEEKILVTARTGTSCGTVTRGVDGSTAYAHASGAVIVPIGTAVDLDEANYMVAQTVGKAAAAGDILVATAANTFTNVAASASKVLTTSAAGTVGYEQLTTAEIADNAATNAKLAGMTRGTVKVGNSSGAASDLALGTSGHFLGSNGTDVGWAQAGWTIVTKTANQTEADQFSAQDDDHLFFTTTAGAVYAIEMYVILARTSGSDNGLAYGLGEGVSSTAGATGWRIYHPSVPQWLATDTAAGAGFSGGTVPTTKIINYAISIHQASGGTWQFKWAPTNIASQQITVYAGSYLTYKIIG